MSGLDKHQTEITICTAYDCKSDGFSFSYNKINPPDNWKLIKIFADDGIFGVHVKKRTQFLEMIELCKKKKIDLILTKSISRFARNTLECIQHVRMLKKFWYSSDF